MRVNKKIKMLLAAALISTSTFAMVGCNDKDQKNNNTKQEQSKKGEDADSSATKKDGEGKNKKSEEHKLIYYTYDINTEKLTSHEKEVKNLSINDVVNSLIDAEVLPKGTKVNKFKFEEKNGVKTLVVDVNEKFVNLNQGSTAEMLQLQCFTNSLVKSFKIKNIKLSVQGGNYSSGHIQLQENETLEFK